MIICFKLTKNVKLYIFLHHFTAIQLSGSIFAYAMQPNPLRNCYIKVFA